MVLFYSSILTCNSSKAPSSLFKRPRNATRLLIDKGYSCLSRLLSSQRLSGRSSGRSSERSGERSDELSNERSSGRSSGRSSRWSSGRFSARSSERSGEWSGERSSGRSRERSGGRSSGRLNLEKSFHRRFNLLTASLWVGRGSRRDSIAASRPPRSKGRKEVSLDVIWHRHSWRGEGKVRLNFPVAGFVSFPTDMIVNTHWQDSELGR